MLKNVKLLSVFRTDRTLIIIPVYFWDLQYCYTLTKCNLKPLNYGKIGNFRIIFHFVFCFCILSSIAKAAIDGVQEQCTVLEKRAWKAWRVGEMKLTVFTWSTWSPWYLNSGPLYPRVRWLTLYNLTVGDTIMKKITYQPAFLGRIVKDFDEICSKTGWKRKCWAYSTNYSKTLNIIADPPFDTSEH